MIQKNMIGSKIGKLFCYSFSLFLTYYGYIGSNSLDMEILISTHKVSLGAGNTDQIFREVNIFGVVL